MSLTFDPAAIQPAYACAYDFAPAEPIQSSRPGSQQQQNLGFVKSSPNDTTTMATAQKQRQNQAITLKGSVALVTEFFEYSVNS